ncbi:MAG: enoyl-CoA hydratase/isomerase family protein [Bradymonadaceae bacterium]|nr:enoyl-CoA hydratase/isomerase family protein [Lujinxingiaceae bacterium]
MTTLDSLEVEDRGDGIVVVTINRPEKLNALSPDVIADLHGAAELLAERTDLRVVILTGAGRAFVAGADIAAMAGFSPNEAHAFGRAGHAALDALSALPVPVIAAVNGFALGGGLELALACDLIYASEKAKFGLPEVTLGIIPGFGGTQRLGRVIGWQAARELVFTGATISAQKAQTLGLAVEIFAPEALLDGVLEIARAIAARGPLAIRAAKDVMRRGSELPLDEANQLEQGGFSGLWESTDRLEGMTAFLEKRAAAFTGE